MDDNKNTHWQTLVEQHGEQVFRISLRILGSVHDAEDVSQEVFFEAYRLHETTDVVTWPGLLVRIATVRAIDRLRRTRRVLELQDKDNISVVQPIDEVEAKELAQWLRAACRS